MSAASSPTRAPGPLLPGAHDIATVATHDRCVRSEALFRGRRELSIVHAGQTYRLSVTRQGKLILTK